MLPSGCSVMVRGKCRRRDTSCLAGGLKGIGAPRQASLHAVTDVGNQVRNAPKVERVATSGRDAPYQGRKGKLDKRWLKGSSDKDMASGYPAE